MYKSALLIICLLLSLQSSAREISGIKLPDVVIIEGGSGPMHLAGAAVRQHNFTPFYLSALYLAEVAEDGINQVPDEYTEKQITLIWLTPAMSDERVDAYWRDAMEQAVNDPQVFARIQQSVDRFVDLFGSVKRGDTFIFEYVPDQGTLLIINGEKAGHITGVDFHRTLMGVWFSDDPRHSEFKKELLGQS